MEESTGKNKLMNIAPKRKNKGHENCLSPRKSPQLKKTLASSLCKQDESKIGTFTPIEVEDIEETLEDNKKVTQALQKFNEELMSYPG